MQLLSEVWMGKEPGGKGWGLAVTTRRHKAQVGGGVLELRGSQQQRRERAGAGRAEVLESRGRAQKGPASMPADLGGRESRQPGGVQRCCGRQALGRGPSLAWLQGGEPARENLKARLGGVRAQGRHPAALVALLTSLSLADPQSVPPRMAQKLCSKFECPNQDLLLRRRWPRESVSVHASLRTPPSATATE